MSDTGAPVVPTVPFTMLGSADAVACEGDSCLVVPPGAHDDPADGKPADEDRDHANLDDEPGRRGVSR